MKQVMHIIDTLCISMFAYQWKLHAMHIQNLREHLSLGDALMSHLHFIGSIERLKCLNR